MFDFRVGLLTDFNCNFNLGNILYFPPTKLLFTTRHIYMGIPKQNKFSGFLTLNFNKTP